jgi:hypothetical protein
MDAAPRNVVGHCVALSDTEGEAVLHVSPIGSGGESSLHPLGWPTNDVCVAVRTLDSFDLDDVGFLKIDVEGHEEALLRGAARTVEMFLPVVFVEIEQRHNPGGIDRVVTWLGERGYRHVTFVRGGSEVPFEQFNIGRDQLSIEPGSAAYANNFIFRPG